MSRATLSLILDISNVDVGLVHYFDQRAFGHGLGDVVNSVLRFENYFSDKLSSLPFRLVDGSRLLGLETAQVLCLALSHRTVFPGPSDRELFRF